MFGVRDGFDITIGKLSEFIEGIGGSAAHELASAVAGWNPYKPDRVAGYFDPEAPVAVTEHTLVSAVLCLSTTRADFSYLFRICIGSSRPGFVPQK